MVLVSVMGEFTPTNYITLFEAAYKSKVVLSEVDHVIAKDKFVLSARIDGTWATLPKFTKTITTMCNKVAGLQLSLLDSSTDSKVEVYTSYSISLEVPEPQTNTIHSLVQYLLSLNCIISKLYLKTHRTQFTNSLVSSGCIEVAVPGDYKTAEAALEDLALVAEASNLLVCVNLNLQ